jgi:hypothetical protein
MNTKYMVCYWTKPSHKKYKWFLTLEEATAFLDFVGRDQGFIEKVGATRPASANSNRRTV